MSLPSRIKIVSTKIPPVVFLLMTHVFSTTITSLAQTEGIPGIESILDSVIAQSKSLPPYSSLSVTTLIWSRPEGSGTSMTQYDSRWDGLRSDCITNSYDLVDNEEVPTYSHRTIWNENGPHNISKQVSVTGSQRRLAVVGLSRDKGFHTSLGSRTFGTYLSGYGGSEESLVELLRHSSNLTVMTQTEDVDGHSCYVLDGTTKKRHLRVWIDPKAGHNIRKIVEERKEDSDISMISIDNIEIRMVDNTWIPMSATYHNIVKDADGRIRNDVTITNKRTQMEFNPDFVKIGAFSMDGIPNGTRVIDFDFPGIHYEWHDGNTVPYVDEYTISSIDDIARGIVKDGGVPPRLGSVNETATGDSKPNALRLGQANDRESQTEVLAETRMSSTLVLILFGLLIVAVLGLAAVCWRRAEGNRNGDA